MKTSDIARQPSGVTTCFSAIVLIAIAIQIGWLGIHGVPLGTNGWSSRPDLGSFWGESEKSFPFAWQKTLGYAIKTDDYSPQVDFQLDGFF